MDHYTELLEECNACICSGVLSEQKKLCQKLMTIDKEYLTIAQYNYLLMKIDNCIGGYYNSLSYGRFYASLNNNERADRTVIYRTTMYLRNMKNNKNKGLLIKSLFQTIRHNKAKFEPDEYNRFLLDVVTSIFKS